MFVKHSFVELAEVQKKSGTLYCGGLDIHGFGGFEESSAVYGLIKKGEVFDIYSAMARFSSMAEEAVDNYASLLAGIENYICQRIVKTLVEECSIHVFKPQFGVYIQFGPAGAFLLQRINSFIQGLEETSGRIIRLLDCKVGDISTTQQGWIEGFMGSMYHSWGINFWPYDFDIINVTPWMGTDVYLFKDSKGNRLPGLDLMEYAGKGLIVVNKTSNPSSPQYQESYKNESGQTLQMGNVNDVYRLSCEAGLEFDGLSTLGLVVGCTHPCDGSIRKAFPTTTMLVPGFGAQGGIFSYIMPELIPSGKWAGQGAIFSASRSTMFAHLKQYGGSGDVRNLENDLIASIARFRQQEKEAFLQSGQPYPFSN